MYNSDAVKETSIAVILAVSLRGESTRLITPRNCIVNLLDFPVGRHKKTWCDLLYYISTINNSGCLSKNI